MTRIDPFSRGAWMGIERPNESVQVRAQTCFASRRGDQLNVLILGDRLKFGSEPLPQQACNPERWEMLTDVRRLIDSCSRFAFEDRSIEILAEQGQNCFGQGPDDLNLQLGILVQNGEGPVLEDGVRV